MTWFERATRKDRVYIVAELGSNYKSREHLLGAINLAKMAGADAIKYQYFDVSELYGPTPQLKKDFPFGDIKMKCDSAQIDFLCSTFSPDGMSEVDKLVDAHKIASSEMSHVRMLERAKKLGKPVILSSGGYFVKDIKRSLDFLGDHPTILMHCNLAYPAKLVDLEKFSQLKDLWTGPIGYSDHTTSVDAVPALMREKGVCIYEKHFNPYELTDTPDAPHSLNTAQFMVMVSYLRGLPTPSTEENEARLMHVRRIVAIKDILPGEKFEEGVNVGIFRSRVPDANGGNPFSMDSLNGRVSISAIKAGSGVSLANADKPSK